MTNIEQAPQPTEGEERIYDDPNRRVGKLPGSIDPCKGYCFEDLEVCKGALHQLAIEHPSAA